MIIMTVLRSASKARIVGLGFVAACFFWTTTTTAITKNYNFVSGTGTWNFGGNWGPSGVPGVGDDVNLIPNTTGTFTVTYDYPGPAIALNTLELNARNSAIFAPTLTFSMAANNLSAQSEFVGEGVVGDISGTATFNQSGGTNTILGALGLILGDNANGQGVYNLSGTGVLNVTSAAGTGEGIGLFGHGQFTQTGGTNQAAFMYVGGDIGGVGDYTLSGPGSLTVSTDEVVGSLGTGTFEQSAGTHTVNGNIVLGSHGNGNGSYTLSGSGSLSASAEYVGEQGTGNFQQSAGTNTISNSGAGLILGGSAGTGTYTLGGTGILSGGVEQIGQIGTGTFTQTGGTNTLGTGSTFQLVLGQFASATGTYNLNAGMLNGGPAGGANEAIGIAGTGTFNQAGGTHNAGTITLGAGASSGTGFYNLSGGQLNSSGGELVAAGTFTQTGGANTIGSQAVPKNLTIGGSRNASYSLNGFPILKIYGDEVIANSGAPGVTASFVQSGGNTSITGKQTIGTGSAGVNPCVGTFSLSGGELDAYGGQYVGVDGGLGTFTQTSGLVSSASLQVGFNSMPSAFVGTTGMYSVSGGTTLIGGSVLVGKAGATGIINLTGGGLGESHTSAVTQFVTLGADGTGTLNHSGGEHDIGDLFDVYELRVGDGGAGAYNLSGTGILNVHGDEIVGNSGVGTFTQTAGSNHVQVMNAGGHGGLTLGYSTGSSGSYLLSGPSALTVDGNEVVGREGAGTFVQSGGVHTVKAGLVVGGIPFTTSTTGSGSYTLSGGVLNVNSTVNVGGIPVHFGDSTAIGVLTVSGSGVLTTPDYVQVGDNPMSGLNLNGGTINCGGAEFVAGPSQFHWTTGVLNFTQSVSSDSLTLNNVFTPTAILSSGQTLMATGDSETLGGVMPFNLTLNAGSTHYVQGTLNLNAGSVLMQNTGSTFYAGTFQMNGGAVGGTLTNQGAFHYKSGLFNGRLINSGTVTLDVPSMTLGNGLENDADIILDAAHTIVSNGGGFTNYGTFTLAGGTLSGNGGAINDFGGAMTAHGAINTTFFNNGRLTVDGTLRFNSTGANSGTMGGSGVVMGTFTNSASGTIDLGASQGLSFTSPWSNSGLVLLEHSTASLGGSTITNFGTIEGFGTISAPVTNSNGVIRASGGELRLSGNGSTNGSGGQIQALSGATLIFSNGLASNNGTISLTGGTFDNNAHTMLNAGTINGTGTMRTSGLTIASGGLLAVGAGDMNVLGAMTDNGTVNIQAGRTAYFFGNVNGAGAYTGLGTAAFLGTFSPGNSAAAVDFSGGVAFGGGTSLVIELGGTTPGTQFDQVRVVGNLALGGTLQVSLIAGFTPTIGQSFDILDWGTLSGTFSAVSLPTLSGLKWDTSQLYASGALRVISPGIPGDFNNDGAVDAADYVAWRKGLVPSTTPNYNLWRAHYGQSADGTSGVGANTAVPEPANLLTMAFAAVALAIRRHGPGGGGR